MTSRQHTSEGPRPDTRRHDEYPHEPLGRRAERHRPRPRRHLIETASHGGLHLAGPALEAIPRTVGATFINGPSWAEEDCELAIALAILHTAGLVPSDKLLGLTPARLADIARRTAQEFDDYACALEHLPAV